MLDQPSGLRFDVYERVHLPEDVAAIEELEEIELTPHIQVIHQGDQVLLRGNLLLSGVYSPQSGSEAQQSLEHWIPVEITLPMNRVHRLEDIAVEIDNFDVDLLSSRTLNITGVLSLQGLQVQQQQASPSWQEEEPITVVHQIEEQRPEAFRNPGQQEEAGEEPANTVFQKSWYGMEPVDMPPQRQPNEVEAPGQWQSNVAEPAETPGQWQSYQEEPAAPTISWEAFTVPDEREQEIEEPSFNEPVNASGIEQERQSGEEKALKAAVEYTSEIEREPAWQEPITESDTIIESGIGLGTSLESKPEPEPAKQEMKIAFSGMSKAEEENQSAGVGIMTLLHSNRREQEARNEAKRQEEQQVAEERADAHGVTGDEVEWKKLFLSNQKEETEFRTVRMCIVQREETLEAIAERYRLNPREIVLYNRLADHTVTEGQVLSIPQSVSYI